jgi:probable F420-dependent oxidoreductase
VADPAAGGNRFPVEADGRSLLWWTSMTGMQLGLALPQFGPSADAGRIAEFAAAAERLGYASLWVGDRLLTPVAPKDPYPGRVPQPYPPEFTTFLDPVVTLAVAAAATTSVRLSSSTLNAPLYHPLVLGRQLTSLDRLSGGRLDAGLGLGWMRDEHETVGADWSTRGARLDEMLDVLRLMWTSVRIAHRGRFFEIPESVLDLRPVQPGGPPVLLAGFTPAALDRVGRRADGWLMTQGLPAAHATMLWDTARRAAETAGRDPSALRRVLRLNRAPDWAAAVAAAAADGITEVFVDLTFSTGGVDAALAVASRLAGEFTRR